jgi:hypothetical protein
LLTIPAPGFGSASVRPSLSRAVPPRRIQPQRIEACRPPVTTSYAA